MVEVIQQAERELGQLIEERAEVTKRIGTVKQTIVGLANLFGDGILDAALLDLVDHRSVPDARIPIRVWSHAAHRNLRHGNYQPSRQKDQRICCPVIALHLVAVR